MYAGVSHVVDIPQNTKEHKIIVAATGYVYLQLDYSWNKEKRQPNTKRISIGKVNPDKPGTMFMNRNYEEHYGPVDPEVEQIRAKFQITRLAGKMDVRLR